MKQNGFQGSLWSILVIALFVGCGDKPGLVDDAPLPINKFDNPQIQRIYELADRRAADSLLPYLSDSNLTVRREAAVVFGSVQDSTALPQLVAMLEDKNEAVVQAAAWALGQIGDSTSSKALLQAMEVNQGEIQATIGEALGKCGGVKDIEKAINLYESDPSKSRSPLATANAVYRAGLRHIVPATGQAFAFSIIRHQDIKVRLVAAAFLGRVAESGPIADPRLLLDALGGNEDNEVRQQLVKAFVRCQDPACTEALRVIAADSKEWEATRANAFRAAGTFHRLQKTAIQALNDSSHQVALAAAEYLDAHLDTTFQAAVEIANTTEAWRPRAIVLKLAVRAAVKGRTHAELLQAESLIDSLMGTSNLYEKAALYSALGEDVEMHDRLVLHSLKNEPITSIYALEAYLAYQLKGEGDQKKVISNIANVMRVRDPGLIAMGAEHITGGSANFIRQIKNTQFLDSALQQLKLPEDIEAYNVVLKAIAKVQGVAPELKHLEFQHPINWALVKRIPQDQTAEITTNRGKIVLRLLVEDTPGTVANFVELIQSDFYTHKRIHRVVPAFVAQGGCPRGDGWGSSPETIRSEWAPLHYTAGMVGMASAGKDTESCQWFITHCEVPHLDGRYTIFAKVIDGLPIVQKLEIGDEIISITLPGFK